MRLSPTVAMLVCWLTLSSGSRAQSLTQSRWAQPAAELAGQIADNLGPGQAQLTIHNLSTIPATDIPAIRKLLEQDLKARGVLTGGAESANTIRLTLSENTRERLWVAEILEGDESRVAMVHVDSASPIQSSAATERLLLRRQAVFISSEPVLAALEIGGGLVVLEPERIVVYSRAFDGLREEQKTNIDPPRQLARDPRGVLLGYAGGSRFEAWIPGVECSGTNSSGPLKATWNIQCRASDDPWAITQPPLELTSFGTQSAQADASGVPIEAFYNSARNYFTGVLARSAGSDLRPFYALAILPRLANPSALLVGDADGKVEMVENGKLRPIAGTRDWGSDFAVVRSGCGTGNQVIVSGSGEAVSDSLRAFEIPAAEAIPASSPLSVDGTVTAMWTAPDGNTAFIVIRNAAKSYEVDRVTALCN